MKNPTEKSKELEEQKTKTNLKWRGGNRRRKKTENFVIDKIVNHRVKNIQEKQ